MIVSGRVQGVFYRDSLRRQAGELGVSGWVRNLTDGRVEAVLEGAADAVDRVLEWARRGPPLARVRGVEQSEEAATGESGPFEVRP